MFQIMFEQASGEKTCHTNGEKRGTPLTLKGIPKFAGSRVERPPFHRLKST